MQKNTPKNRLKYQIPYKNKSRILLLNICFEYIAGKQIPKTPIKFDENSLPNTPKYVFINMKCENI